MRSARLISFIVVAAALVASFQPAAAAAPAPAAPEAPVIHDSVEQIATSLAANFDTDMAALTTAKSVTALAAVTVYRHVPVAPFVADDAAAPLIAIYSPRALTHAKRQGYRDSRNTIIVELFLRGSTADTVRKQAELGAEAIMRTVDRVEGLTGLVAAGEQEGSVEVSIDGTADAKGGQEQYEETVRVTFAVLSRDDNLG